MSSVGRLFLFLETFSFDHVFAARAHRHTRPRIHLVDNLVRLPPQLILDKEACGVGVVPNHQALSSVKYSQLCVRRFLFVLPADSQLTCPRRMPLCDAV